MDRCTCENWTLEELSNALLDSSKDNKRIVVPMFQRGKRWKKMQEHTFIDSMRKGYPVGTMLFYKKVVDNKENYILVDGLQRGNTIRKYMANPTEFFSMSEISDQVCNDILEAMNIQDGDTTKAKQHMFAFVRDQKKFDFSPTQYFSLSKELCDLYDASFASFGENVINVLSGFFNDGKSDYEQISKAIIPVIIYNGDENNLPEIFDRINSRGTPLNLYEVYAASWPVNQKFYVATKEIVEAVVRKYEILREDGYIIDGYNKEKFLEAQELNAFEYMFGLSKYLTSKYKELAFETSLDDDAVNSLAFELVNACLNDSDKIKTLHERINQIDVNIFQEALEKAIVFVTDSLQAVTRFKGNKRNADKIFHSKFQILSMISTTFKDMYADGIYSHECEGWKDKKDIIQKNLLHYYVYDILTNYWFEGGTGKIHAAYKPSNRYLNPISDRSWMVAIGGYFESTMQRQESEKVKNVSKEDYVFLNCIYLNTFTAMDQLSIEKFDVEHIAPKAQMQKLIKKTNSHGLPISSIANLCYLPEFANRSKRDKNFYQDKKYRKLIDLNEVEAKYSFTTESDLEWMDIDYGVNDTEFLIESYNEFLNSRFQTLKELFCKSLGISIVDISDIKQKAYEALNDESMSEYVTVIGTGKTKDEFYRLEDMEPTSKGRYMKAVIEYYYELHPEMTYEELLTDLLQRTVKARFWPQIIALPSEIKKNQRGRYLDNAETTIKSHDGFEFAICNQCNPERMNAIIQLACECKLHTEISYFEGKDTPAKENSSISVGAPFRFSMVDLKEGDKVIFEPLNLEVAVANDKEVEYQGKLYTTTGFCKEFLPGSMRNSSGAYQGPKYFIFNGKALSELRKEKENEQ